MRWQGPRKEGGTLALPAHGSPRPPSHGASIMLFPSWGARLGSVTTAGNSDPRTSRSAFTPTSPLASGTFLLSDWCGLVLGTPGVVLACFLLDLAAGALRDDLGRCVKAKSSGEAPVRPLALCQLDDLGQGPLPSCASVSLSVKWGSILVPHTPATNSK